MALLWISWLGLVSRFGLGHCGTVLVRSSLGRSVGVLPCIVFDHGVRLFWPSSGANAQQKRQCTISCVMVDVSLLTILTCVVMHE